MTYYTNSNQIKDLMTSLTRLEVVHLEALESLSGVSVLLFDALFPTCLPDYTLRTESVLRLRPDWMGTILELMKKNEEVYLHWGEEWCRVLYREDADDFRFVHCKDPNLYDDCTCLIATQPLVYRMRQAINDLLEPVRFGEGMAERLLGLSNDYKVKSLLTFDRADYREMCLKMEGLMSDVMHQRDTWKDRFFFKALEADRNDLCSYCKEDMRKTFYDKGDEEAALQWRPGDYDCGCVARKRCKDYSWESFEDQYHEDYLKDIKVDEFVSDISSDEGCNSDKCKNKESQ